MRLSNENEMRMILKRKKRKKKTRKEGTKKGEKRRLLDTPSPDGKLPLDLLAQSSLVTWGMEGSGSLPKHA